MNSPQELLGSSKLTLNHEYNNMAEKIIASFNDKTVSIDGSLSLNNDISGDIKVTTPITGYKNLGLKFAHRGKINNFHSEASVDYADNKNINGQIDFTANDIKNIRLSAELNTPQELVGSSKISFNHKYNDMTVKTIASFNDETVSIDGSLQLNNEISGDLKVTTPITGYKSLGLKFAHRGQINNFHSEASVDYYNNKNINGQIDLTANSIKNIRLSAELNTPQDLLGSSKMSFNHKYNNMAVRTIANFNGKTVSIDGSLKHNDDIFGDIKLSTPITGYKNIGLKFVHRGQINNFHSEASVDYADYKNINGQMDFAANDINKIRITGQLNTP